MLPSEYSSPATPPPGAVTREYRRTRFSRFKAYVVNPAIGLGILVAFLYAIHGTSPGGWSMLWLSVLIIILGVWLAFGFTNASCECFLLGPDLLEYTDRSGTRAFVLDDIDSYSSSEKSTLVLVHFKNSDNPDISFDSGFERYLEIAQWLAARYPDKRLVTARKEKQRLQQVKQDLLANPVLGSSNEERAEALRQARRIARWLNAAGVLTAVALWLPPEPSEWAITAGLLVPLGATGALWWHPQVLRLDGSDDNGYPSPLLALGIPSLGLLLSSQSYFGLVSHDNLWPIVAAASGGLLLLLVRCSRQFLRPPNWNFSLAALLPPLAFLYCYSACSMINVVYDTSRGRTFTSTVLKRSTSSSKYQNFYYLKLSAWGPWPTAHEASVNYHVYANTQQGDTIPVVLHPGLLGAPWYRVDL